jgi:hypothetical protein
MRLFGVVTISLLDINDNAGSFLISLMYIIMVKLILRYRHLHAIVIDHLDRTTLGRLRLRSLVLLERLLLNYHLCFLIGSVSYTRAEKRLLLCGLLIILFINNFLNFLLPLLLLGAALERGCSLYTQVLGVSAPRLDYRNWIPTW